MVRDNMPLGKPIAERQASLMQALRDYGVFDAAALDGKGAPDFLASQFVLAWLECWRANRWEMMSHYIDDACEVLFDRTFGTGLNSGPPADPAGEKLPPHDMRESGGPARG